MARRGIGDNSGHAEDVLNGVAQSQLKSIVERIERLNTERDEIGELIKEVKLEAKGNGFDVKIINKVVQIRKMDPAKRAETEALVDLYEHALETRPAKAKPKPAVDDDDPEGVG